MTQRFGSYVLALLACAVLVFSEWPLQAQTELSPRDQYLQAAKAIRLPEYKVRALPFEEALVRLSAASRLHDPNKTGVNFLINPGGTAKAKAKVTLDLKNVSVDQVAEALAKQVGLEFSVRAYAFVFTEQDTPPKESR